MAKPFSDFIKLVLGHAYDIDGAYGAQCWDGYAKYVQWLGYPIIYCTVTGGARDLWEQRNSNGILRYTKVVTKPQNGDICVWAYGSSGAMGHVAMYYNGQYLGQNQGGTPYPTGGSAFNIISYQKPSGYLRPNCYANGAGADTGTPDSTGDCGSGLEWIVPVTATPDRTSVPLSSDSDKENNAKCFYGYFAFQGWTLNAVCGMLGNIEHESGIQPARWQGDNINSNPMSTEGYGLVQWTPYTNITNYLKKVGVWMKDFTGYGNAECDKIMEEFNNGGQWIPSSYSSMTFEQFSKSTLDAGNLALIFQMNYERPLVPQQARAETARKWYEKLKDYTPVFPDGTCGQQARKKRNRWLWYLRNINNDKER